MPFVKGQSGNPTGKNAGCKPYLELIKELAATKKSKGKSLIKHAIERAYTNDKVLVAVLKKIIPDKVQSDLDVGLSFKEISDEYVVEVGRRRNGKIKKVREVRSARYGYRNGKRDEWVEKVDAVPLAEIGLGTAFALACLLIAGLGRWA